MFLIKRYIYRFLVSLGMTIVPSEVDGESVWAALPPKHSPPHLQWRLSFRTQWGIYHLFYMKENDESSDDVQWGISNLFLLNKLLSNKNSIPPVMFWVKSSIYRFLVSLGRTIVPSEVDGGDCLGGKAAQTISPTPTITPVLPNAVRNLLLFK